jgi:hypothetical protein
MPAAFFEGNPAVQLAQPLQNLTERLLIFSRICATKTLRDNNDGDEYSAVSFQDR